MWKNWLALVIVAPLIGCGHRVIVVDDNGTRLSSVHFSHNHTGGPGWYVSHDRTDDQGRAYVTPMHAFWSYQTVRADRDGYASRELSRDAFEAHDPAVVVLRRSQ